MGTSGAGFEVGTPSGTHLGRGGSLYLIIHVLADFLQGALDALQIIVSHSPAAAVLRIILTVHKDCPPIFYLAFIVLEAVVVNAEAAALGGIVVHGILRFADAADGVFFDLYIKKYPNGYCARLLFKVNLPNQKLNLDCYDTNHQNNRLILLVAVRSSIHNGPIGRG